VVWHTGAFFAVKKSTEEGTRKTQRKPKNKTNTTKTGFVIPNKVRKLESQSAEMKSRCAQASEDKTGPNSQPRIKEQTKNCLGNRRRKRS